MDPVAEMVGAAGMRPVTGAGASAQAATRLSIGYFALGGASAGAIAGAVAGSLVSNTRRGTTIGATIGLLLGGAFGGFTAYEITQATNGPAPSP